MITLITFLAVTALLRTVVFFVPAKKKGIPILSIIPPVYGDLQVLKIIDRPWWWMILLYIPVVGPIMYLVVVIETLQVHGKRNMTDFLLAILTAGLYLPAALSSKDTVYEGPTKRGNKTGGREWSEAVTFAIIAATLIRTFGIESYTIPTSSMEKSMRIGDFLFVSKINYGPRMPMTPFSVPLVHNQIPIIGAPSYLELLKLPYFRLPGFADVKRDDIVVFNYPMDTDLPVDKRTNYIKRCVGIPGDSIELRDAQLYVNGSPQVFPDRSEPQLSYLVQTNGQGTFSQRFLEEMDITEGGQRSQTEFVFLLSSEKAETLRSLSYVSRVEPLLQPAGEGRDMMFPEGGNQPWNTDQYGPIYIPKAGATVALTEQTLPFYERIIEVYEGHELRTDGSTILIDGEEADNYTFEMNYYWMMGDNRHNSLDSRFWGYVPEDHIVGRASFIWMSYDGQKSQFSDRFRTDRIFTFVHGKGDRHSLLIYFVVLMVGFTVFKRIRKRRSNAA